jgi:uncharacterized membrane protein HdeD (DUF308 family)
MGIKRIHITLITASIILSLFFGFWALGHNFRGLGYFSLLTGIVLVFYGIQFIKKAKVL